MDNNGERTSDQESTVNLTEITLLKLAESISQQNATALISIAVPEFSGGLNEDVFDFLRRYKMATVSLSEEMRVKALQKALTGPAYVWAKNNIKEYINKGTNWKGIKKALIERFQEPNSDRKFHEKLAKMKFDPSVGTLTSYLELYKECFSKVYSEAKDSDTISALKLNLPNNIQRGLNLLNDQWTSFTSMNDLFKLAKRVEEKILPFEKDETAEEKLSASSLVKILEDFKSSLKNAKPEDKKSTSQDTEVLAALQTNNNSYNGPTHYQNKGYNNNWRNNRNRYNKSYQTKEDRRSSSVPYSKDNKVPQGKTNESSEEKGLRETYIATYGVPPGPCYSCGGFHFNRHCPLRAPNDLK